MELATTIEFGEPFVKATYRLEGDEPLALAAYEEIVTLYASISAQHFPNTLAVATTKLSPSTIQKRQLIDCVVDCIKPAVAYFKQKFECDLKEVVAAFF